MCPPHVERQVPGTNNFKRIGFSGPDLLLCRQRGFVLLTHVATELGPIFVDTMLKCINAKNWAQYLCASILEAIK